jgi:formylglycine-generating enzyme required for sulfatase activity
MSDDWNLHDAVEDGIRENAGHLALAGALMAHSQRQKQLQSLEASRQHQAQIAKTEAQRLEIEKQRLELERLRHQEEKDRHEAVRLLRVMMAEVGAEFDGLQSRGQLKGSPQGVRRDYAMAVLLSKLALIRSRSGSLSDLNDLKELSRLENLAQEMLSQHFAGRDPLQIARSKWREIETWMAATDQFKEEVKKACGVVPDSKALQLPSKAELAEKRRQLEDLMAQLPARLESHANRLPIEAAADGSVLPELAEQAQLDDLRESKKARRATVFASRWRMVATVKRPLEPDMRVTNEVQPELVVAVQGALNKLGDWQNLEAAHEAELRDLSAALEEGRLQDAKASAKKLGGVKFAGLVYQPVASLQALQKELEALALAKRGAATHAANEIRAKYPKAGSQSQLIQVLQGHLTRAKGEKRSALITALVLLGLLSGGAKLMVDQQREQQRLKAEAKAKAGLIRKELSTSMAATTVGSLVDVPLTSGLRQTFALIPSGSFTMGNLSGEEGTSIDESQVEVTLSQPFWLAKTEVTQAQWEALMGSNPSSFKGPNLPVENVSWEDAQAYIAMLNEKGILPEGWKFALPTEAQWEYACRAGEKGPYSGGSLDEVGWYDGNSGSQTHEVGQKKPNAWGLHDMHGNVYEWCADQYDYWLNGGTDPTGPTSGDRRVDRGGSWRLGAYYCRAAYRYRLNPGYRSYELGFRSALVPSR